MKLKHRIVAALFALGAVAILPAHASPRVGVNIVIGNPPPPVRYEVVPAPRRGYVWAPGYWDWNGRRHVWIVGHWERFRSGRVYYRPEWRHARDGWHLERGGWQSRHRPSYREHRDHYGHGYDHDRHR